MARWSDRVIDRWKCMLYDYPITPLEITTGWLWFVWGLQLLTMPDLLDGGRVHQITRELFVEWQLGLIYLGLGCLMLVGATARHRPTRRLGAVLSAVGWISQGILAVAAAGLGNLTTGLDAVMATGSLWMTWRWAGQRPERTP